MGKLGGLSFKCHVIRIDMGLLWIRPWATRGKGYSLYTFQMLKWADDTKILL